MPDRFPNRTPLDYPIETLPPRRRRVPGWLLIGLIIAGFLTGLAGILARGA